MKKKILPLLLAAVVTSSALAGCGNSAGTNTGSASEESGSPSASSVTSSETSESSAVSDEEPYNVKFMYLNLVEGDRYNAVAEAVSELAQKEINMTVDLIPVSYGTMTSTTNMMLAANEPLDLCFRMASFLASDISCGYILNWADYLDEIPDIVDYYGDELNCGYIGDFMAGIGVVRQRTNDFALVCRKDIMDELGYSESDFSVDPVKMTGYDKVEEMFDAVQAAYPGMTVIAGQQGFASYVGNFNDSLSDGYGVLADYGQDTTVTNWYESDQFRELCKISKRWFDRHYYSSDAATSQDTGETLMKAGNMFSYLVGSKSNTAAEKKAQTGYDVYVIPMQGVSTYTTSGYTAFQYCLANASEDPVKAAQFYNWAFTSEAFEDLINWGIEGEDWVEGEDGLAYYPEGKDASSGCYHNDLGWIYPNQTAGHPWEGNTPDVWDVLQEASKTALKSVAFGFTYDSTPVSDQLTACSAASEQYTKILAFGTSADVDATIDEYNEKLYAAGLQEIMDEKQAQLDAWLAENGK